MRLFQVKKTEKECALFLVQSRMRENNLSGFWPCFPNEISHAGDPVSWPLVASLGYSCSTPIWSFSLPHRVDVEKLIQLESAVLLGDCPMARLQDWLSASFPHWKPTDAGFRGTWWCSIWPVDAAQGLLRQHSAQAWLELEDPLSTQKGALEKCFPYKLPEEAAASCLTPGLLKKLFWQWKASGALDPVAVRFIRNFVFYGHPDLGMFQLQFLICSIALSAHPRLLISVFKHSKFWLMDRAGGLKVLKRFHVAIKRSAWLPWLGELTPSAKLSLLYCHFIAGRGWKSDNEEEWYNRQAVRHPLRALDANSRSMSEARYRELESSAIRLLFEKISPKFCQNPMEDLRSYFNNRMQGAPHGSASGVRVVLPPEPVSPPQREIAVERLTKLGAKRCDARVLVHTASKEDCPAFQIAVKSSPTNLQRCVEICTHLPEGFTTVGNLGVVARLLRNAVEFKAGGSFLTVGSKPATVAINDRQAKRLSQLLSGSPIGSGDSELLSNLVQLVPMLSLLNSLRQHNKSQIIRCSKSVWLETLTWGVFEKFLHQPPILRGTCFQKNEIAVARLLIAAEPSHILLSRYVLRNLDECYSSHPWCDLGYSAAEDVRNKVRRLEIIYGMQGNGIVMGLDFKDFNSSHLLESMSDDYLILRDVMTPKLTRAENQPTAVSDWRAACEWLSTSQRNCWVRFEGETESRQVGVGLFSGTQDTNGCNERRQVVEAYRAQKDLAACGHDVFPSCPGFKQLELRGDDSLAIFQSPVLAALWMTAFCASGRPMERVKQELGSSSAEYLRCTVSSHGVQGPPLRSIGTMLCASFENASKNDHAEATTALHSQCCTLVRRGCPIAKVRVLWDCLSAWWTKFRVPGAAGETHHPLPAACLFSGESRNGLGLLLHPCEMLTPLSSVPTVPRLTVRRTRAADVIPARGTSDLLWRPNLMYAPTEVLQATLKTAVNQLHRDVCVSAALGHERLEARDSYLQQMRERFLEQQEPVLASSTLLRVDSNGGCHPFSEPFLWLEYDPEAVGDCVPEVQAGPVPGAECMILRVSKLTTLRDTLVECGANCHTGVIMGRMLDENKTGLSQVLSDECRIWFMCSSITTCVDRQTAAVLGGFCLPADYCRVEPSLLPSFHRIIPALISELELGLPRMQLPAWPHPVDMSGTGGFESCVALARSQGLSWHDLAWSLIKQKRGVPYVGSMALLNDCVSRHGSKILAVFEHEKLNAPKCLQAMLGPLVSSRVRAYWLGAGIDLIRSGTWDSIRTHAPSLESAMLRTGIALSRRWKLIAVSQS